ncbi:MAG: ATP-dependent Clp protease adaptor ClpS [Deltaproteobacteria bacterium]|jgi:ATP-dependent Clp protease adaptor protein ClpS
MSTKPGAGGSTDVLAESEQKTKEPSLYKVLFHNDDYTTMEFVVSVLMTVFHHNQASAYRIMMHIHTNGMGVAGVYTKEVAETKVAQTVAIARKNEFPLEVTIEPE